MDHDGGACFGSQKRTDSVSLVCQPEHCNPEEVPILRRGTRRWATRLKTRNTFRDAGYAVMHLELHKECPRYQTGVTEVLLSAMLWPIDGHRNRNLRTRGSIVDRLRGRMQCDACDA